jgi:hypothetical protein
VLALLGEPPDPALPAELRAAVAAIAVRWAEETGTAFVSDRVVPGAGGFAEPEPEGVAAAVAAVLAGHRGPLLLVGPDVPRLDATLAAGALGDLEAGCVFSFAPATDGKPFLLAFREVSDQALALLGSRDRRRDEVFAQAMALGGEVGMLRSERRLVTPADAVSLALDPLVPAELRDLATRASGAA